MKITIFGVYPVFRPKHPETFDDLKRMSQVGFDDKQLRYRVKLHSDGTIKVVAKKNMKVLTYQDIFPHAPSPAPSASAGPDVLSIPGLVWSYTANSSWELFLGREFPMEFPWASPCVLPFFSMASFMGSILVLVGPLGAQICIGVPWFPARPFPQGPSYSSNGSIPWMAGHRIC